jgi:hypothetical protein
MEREARKQLASDRRPSARNDRRSSYPLTIPPAGFFDINTLDPVCLAPLASLPLPLPLFSAVGLLFWAYRQRLYIQFLLLVVTIFGMLLIQRI